MLREALVGWGENLHPPTAGTAVRAPVPSAAFAIGLAFPSFEGGFEGGFKMGLDVPVCFPDPPEAISAKAGEVIDLTIGNKVPKANPPTKVALLITFRREIVGVDTIGVPRYCFIRCKFSNSSKVSHTKPLISVSADISNSSVRN